MPRIETEEIPEEILNNPIDQEEKEFLESINWTYSVMFTKDEIMDKSPQEVQQIADDMLKKTKQISIKIPIWLLEEIKKKAAKEGLPYQTYIKHILHKEIF